MTEPTADEWTITYAKSGDRHQTTCPTLRDAVALSVDGTETGAYAVVQIVGPDGQVIEGDALSQAELRFQLPDVYGSLEDWRP